MTATLDPFDATIAAQRQAATPAASAWVSANAGSGKTRVLTDRVIRLMLNGAEPSEILSITFTKAAAAEMSNRLFERLGRWAAIPDVDLRHNLIELAGDEIGSAFPLAAARKLFARALETPGGLKIQTIHAFAESVLGRFPLEAGISPEFKVIDDAASEDLLLELKQKLLTGEGLDSQAMAALERLLAWRADQSFDDLLSNAIGLRRTIINAIEQHNGIPGTVDALRIALGIESGDTGDIVRRRGCSAGQWNEVGLRRVVNTLRQEKGVRAQERADLITAWLASDEEGRLLMLDDYFLAYLTQKGEPRAASGIYPAGARKSDPGGEDVLLQEQVRVLELVDCIRAADTADLTHDLLRITVPLLTRYAEAKQRRSLLDYDDQIDKTLDLLRSQAGWVHYKLDQGISHILIDEAQDTSPEQWQIAELLSEEFFVGAGAKQGPRTVFAVGDEKQSIYSFQGADPDGFDRMKQQFRARTGQAHGAFEDVRLELSFRSAPEILQAVDAVFAGEARTGLTASGDPVTHQARRASARGLVELWPLDAPGDAEEPQRWRAPLDVEGAASTARKLAWRIARRIRRMIDDGETVRKKGSETEEQCRITPGDVLILVRSRGPLVDEIARALKSTEINLPVAGADRMALTGQIAVMDLMALGDFLLMPDDDLTLATVLKSPFYNLTDDDLFDLAWDRGDGVRLWRVLQDRGAERSHWQEALIELRAMLAEADQTPPYAFFSHILSGRGGRRRLHARLGADQMDPLDEFLNAALEDERENPPSLQGFLHRLRRREAVIKRDMDQGLDAVRIMTVHGAKGLEAPVVFLPDTARPARGEAGGLMKLPQKDGCDLPVIVPNRAASPDRLAQEIEAGRDRRLAEYSRLLYVAMTRAEDRLYICGHYNSERAKPSEDGWYKMVEAGIADLAEPAEDGILRLGGTAANATRSDTSKRTADIPVWLSAPLPDEPTPPRPLAPSRAEATDPARSSPLSADQAGAGRRRGVLIHHLLEVLPGLPSEYRQDAGIRSLARRAADLTEDERDEMLSEALAVINDPAMAPVFGSGSRAEAAVTGMVGTRVVSGQVDRLAVTDAGVWIVDYKTNRPPPLQVANTPVAYLRQMALYRAVIQQIYPGQTVHAALVWTWETRMMVLPEKMLDASLASLDLVGVAT